MLKLEGFSAFQSLLLFVFQHLHNVGLSEQREPMLCKMITQWNLNQKFWSQIINCILVYLLRVK